MSDTACQCGCLCQNIKKVGRKRSRRRSFLLLTSLLCSNSASLVYAFSDLQEGFHTDPDSISIAMGTHHTCALERRPGVDFGGAVKCWGRDDWGQGSPPEDMFIQISGGDRHTCGVRLDQRLACWGIERYSPPGLYQQVSAGGSHTCALSTTGSIKCWGDNSHGKANSPIGDDFVQVVAGGSFTCALRRNGLPMCWGKNHVGQSSPPQHVQLRQLSASTTDHACGIVVNNTQKLSKKTNQNEEESIPIGEKDGDIICWGRNRVGEAKPRRGPWWQVSCGQWSTCAIHEAKGGVAGTAECWGVKQYSVPTQYEELVTSSFHTCAASAEGEIHCWGDAEGSEKVPDGFQLA